MKKLDNKMLKEKEGEQQKYDSDVVDTSITCDCCSELPTIQPVTTRKEGEENGLKMRSMDTATIKRRNSCSMINCS